jgi:sialic acid synthase SpsE
LSRTTVVVEAAVNHDGSIDVALELVDVAASASAAADVVKSQTLDVAQVVTADVPQAARPGLNRM